MPWRLSDSEKKTVWSETRAACCMLWVTTTIVYWRESSRISSSIRNVEIGSRAEQGSSIRDHVRVDRQRPGDA